MNYITGISPFLPKCFVSVMFNRSRFYEPPMHVKMYLKRFNCFWGLSYKAAAFLKRSWNFERIMNHVFVENGCYFYILQNFDFRIWTCWSNILFNTASSLQIADIATRGNNFGSLNVLTTIASGTVPYHCVKYEVLLCKQYFCTNMNKICFNFIKLCFICMVMLETSLLLLSVECFCIISL